MKKNIDILSYYKKWFHLFIIVFLTGYYSILLYAFSKRKNAVKGNNDGSLYHLLIITFFPILLSALVSFLLYRKITLIGYFIGFVIQWILFLNVNPYPLQIDNKYAIMQLIPEKYRPETQFLLSDIQYHSYSLPIIVKPILCSGSAKNVVIITTMSELNSFMKQDTTILSNYMVQNFLYDYCKEVGVLWEKSPFEKEGRVIEIIEQTPRNILHVASNIKYKNYSHLINDNIQKRFYKLSTYIPNMNVCRYDIRVKHMEDLEKGDFKIVEVNGAMGMPNMFRLHNGLLYNMQITLRWIVIRLFIGLHNICTLQGYSLLHLPYVMLTSYYKLFSCTDPRRFFTYDS